MEEIQNLSRDDFLEFDDTGRYDFLKCEGCDGPLSGYLEVKFKGKEGVGYLRETGTEFENYLKRVGGFKEAILARKLR